MEHFENAKCQAREALKELALIQANVDDAFQYMADLMRDLKETDTQIRVELKGEEKIWTFKVRDLFAGGEGYGMGLGLSFRQLLPCTL